MSTLNLEVDEKVKSSSEKRSKEKSLNENTNMKNLLRTWVTDEYETLLKTFTELDNKKNSTISVEDFKNTIGKLFFPLEDKYFEDILSEILRKSDGTIFYRNFLNQFCNMNPPRSPELMNFVSKTREVITPTSVSPSPYAEENISLEEIQQILSEKFCKNVFTVLKAFQFYDYNRNGRINKINFRRVLEKFGFKMTNRQFERFWQTESSNHSCILDYNRFLQKLVTSGNTSNSSSGNTDNFPSAKDFWDPKTGIVIQPSSTWPAFQKVFQLSLDEENMILRRLELVIRDVIHRHHYSVRKAFEMADPKLQGLVRVEDLKKILESYIGPMTDKLFSNLLQCFGLEPTGFIAWQVFLTKFRCPKEVATTERKVEFMDIPKQIVPLKNSECHVDANTVLHHLRQTFTHQYGSIENAFKKLDHRGRGWLTRTDIEIEARKLYYHLNEREHQEVFVKLDPEHKNKISLPKFLEVLEGKAIELSVPQHDPVLPKTMTLEKVEQVLRENLVGRCEELNNQICLASTKEKGFLCSKRLKSILDTVVFPLEEQHFQSLLSRYATPRKDGLIDCQQFLEKLVGSQNLFIVPNPSFEEAVSHNSCMQQKAVPQNFCMQQKMEPLKCCLQPVKKNIPSREPSSSVLVTAEKFPYILAEKSQKDRQNITKNYLTYRKAGKDILNLELLQNLLKMYDICISGTELNKLWKRCDPEEKGYALYEEFLTGCGLEEVYKRNDEVGSMGYILMWKVASEIGPGFAGSTNKVSSIPQPRSKSANEKKFDGPSPEFRLREFIIRSPHNIWKSISNLDMSKDGQILASEIRRVLIGYGLRMSDAEWNFILDAVGTEGKNLVNLKTFIQYVMLALESADLSKGPTNFQTLQEVENAMRPILSDLKSDILREFRLADVLKFQVVSKEDLENILKKFRIIMDTEMFEKLWSTAPVNENNKLIYKDFLAKYSRNTNRCSTAVPTIKPTLPERPNTAPVLHICKAQPETSSEPFFVRQNIKQAEWKIPRPEEQLHYDANQKGLVEIVSRKLEDVITKLSEASGQEDPLVPPEVLKSILESVAHPIDPDTFNSLLSQFVTERLDGLVNYQEFLMRLVPGRSNSGRSLGGDVRRVIPSISHEKNKPYNSVTASQLPALLAKLAQNHYHNVTKGYLTFSKAGKDIITMDTLKNFLKAFNISMSDTELNKIWRQCDPEDKQYITYEEFLERCGLEEVYTGSSKNGASKYVIIWKLVDKGPNIHGGEQNTHRSDMMAGENRGNLSPEYYLRESLMNMPDEIWSAISDLDVQKSDLVPTANLQSLLTTKGIQMTDNEWKQVLQPYLNKNGLVNIKLFISNLLYGTSQPNASEIQLTSKYMKEIQKIISTHSNDFLVAFKEADYAGLNAVSQETFQSILKKFGITMDQKTFLKLWSLLPVNGHGNLMYQDFLNWINAQTTNPYAFKRPSTANIHSYEPWKPPGPHLPSAGRIRGITSKEILPLEIHEIRRRKRAATADATRKRERPCYSGRLVNAEQAEILFRDVILGNWKLIQKRCRSEDPECMGYIDPEKFKGILHHYMKNIQEEKFMKLREKFDIKGDGTLAYKDLIRYFVFNLKPSKITPGQHRLLRKPEKDEYDTVPTEGLLGEALRRLRQCVAKNWRLMRRSFQIADPSKSDTVDILTFRQILKVHNVNLTEEEFFQIMSFYDKDFSASINYNSFLRAFLGNR